MATVTLGNVKPAGYVHAGLNALVCKVSLSTSWSSGDVHIIGKLPRGAIVLDTVFYPGADSPVTLIAKFGTSKSQEAFFVSDSWCDVTPGIRSTPRLGTSQKISVSDALHLRPDVAAGRVHGDAPEHPGRHGGRPGRLRLRGGGVLPPARNALRPS